MRVNEGNAIKHETDLSYQYFKFKITDLKVNSYLFAM